jgi:hypothetical protein
MVPMVVLTLRTYHRLMIACVGYSDDDDGGSRMMAEVGKVAISILDPGFISRGIATTLLKTSENGNLDQKAAEKYATDQPCRQMNVKQGIFNKVRKPGQDRRQNIIAC